MVGVLLGSYIFGEASDRFGRKPTFIASVVIQSVFGLLAGVLPGYFFTTVLFAV
jgi:OCT family organic cation transporter-like MFS transporter 4/5